MINALSGWLGLTLVIAALVAAVAVDFRRQASRADGQVGKSEVPGEGPTDAQVFWLTITAVVLAVLAAVATLVRFFDKA